MRLEIEYKKIKPRRLKKKFKTFLKTLAREDFLIFLVLVIIFLIFSAGVWYKYVITVQRETFQAESFSKQFKKKTLERLIEIKKEKEKEFQEGELEEYKNPFLLSP